MQKTYRGKMTMKTLKVLLATAIFLLVACGDFSNPLSSESNEQDNTQDHAPLYSGTSEQG